MLLAIANTHTLRLPRIVAPCLSVAVSSPAFADDSPTHTERRSYHETLFGAAAVRHGQPIGCGCVFVVWVIVTEQLMRLLQSKAMKGTMNLTLQLQSFESFGLLQLSKAQDEPAGGKGARTAV
jgi:hypothetical protein